MTHFKSILRSFIRRKEGKAKPLQERGKSRIEETLEEITAKSPFASVSESDPHVEPQVTITDKPPIDSLPKIITVPRYQKIDRESLILLEGWRIKGEPQIEIARTTTLEQLKAAYGRISQILSDDVGSFLRFVPVALTYRNSYLESYAAKLATVSSLIKSKYGNKIPKEYDWKRNPGAFRNVESLSELEERLKTKDNGLDTELLKHKKTLQAAGYDFDVVSAIIQKGFNLYSANPNVGYTYIPFRHIRSNVMRAIKNEIEIAKLEYNFSRMIGTNAILEPATKKASGGRFGSVYSLNPHIAQISEPELRDYVSYLFAKKTNR